MEGQQLKTGDTITLKVEGRGSNGNDFFGRYEGLIIFIKPRSDENGLETLKFKTGEDVECVVLNVTHNTGFVNKK